MDKNVKILIGVIIVLVAVTGVMAGFILQSHIAAPVVADNATVMENNTTTSTSQEGTEATPATTQT